MTSSTRVRLGQVVLLVKPDTLLKWHRDLVRRKWTFTKKAPLGRPPINPDLEALILRLAREPNLGLWQAGGRIGQAGL